MCAFCVAVAVVTACFFCLWGFVLLIFGLFLFEGKKGCEMLGREVGRIWENLGEGEEYNKTILDKILK